MKILMIQLAIPRINPLEYKSNIPLAPAYLKNYVLKNYKNKDLKINILPRVYSDQMSPNAIIDYILIDKPDIISFTLYMWNIEKSLYIAEKVKNILPTIDIIFGGPEVNADNSFLLNSKVFEKGIVGEGEISFLRYLEKVDYEKIPRILYKKGENIVYNESKEIINCQKDACMPYLDKIIDKDCDICMFFETVRGCPFSCSFCYYNKVYDKINTLPIEYISKNLDFALENDFKEIFLLDPSFNVQPYFSKIVDLIISKNIDKKIEFHTELRADLLDKNDIEKLSKMNLKGVEVGLQSINENVLKLMNRKQDINKFKENVILMQNLDIECKVDLIIGLPGDTLESFKKSALFVRENNLHANIQVFNLSILSGTEYSKNSKKYGINYQKKPPYYVESTSLFSNEEIYEAFEFSSEIFEITFDPLPKDLLSTDFSKIKKTDFLINSFDINKIHKIIFKNLNFNLKCIVANLTESVVLHFLIDDFKSKIDLISNILHDITHECPFNIFTIIFELKEKVDLLMFKKIFDKMYINEEHFVNLDAESFHGKGTIISNRIILIVDKELCLSKWAQNMLDYFDVYVKLDSIEENKILDLINDGYRIFFTGDLQNELYEKMKDEEEIEDIIFDDFSIEYKKLQYNNKELKYYYPHIIII